MVQPELMPQPGLFSCETWQLLLHWGGHCREGGPCCSGAMSWGSQGSGPQEPRLVGRKSRARKSLSEGESSAAELGLQGGSPRGMPKQRNRTLVRGLGRK